MRVRQLLVLVAMTAGLLVPQAARATEFTYATMSDGVKIAISVNFPAGYTPGAKYPALFAMDGYAGGAGTNSTQGDNYIGVYASIRGTGCSGGRYDLFDRRHALDGYEIIEGWIVNQPWSNRDVGITGHSYPGLTGWLVAATNPPHVKAVAISGLIDDLYRGIVYPGGVPNYGFPAVWTGAYRPASELSGNAGRYVGETTGGDPTCAANIASRPPREPLDDPIAQGLTSQQDETWWAVRSTLSYIHGIRKPIHITQQYQDEQTGPRGGHVLFENIAPDVPKRIAITNGVHGTNALANADKRAWLDCWIRNVCVGDIADPAKRVRLFFETRNNTTRAPEYIGSDWPLPETEWLRYTLSANGSLIPGDGTSGQTSYVSTSQGRHMTADAGMGFGDEGIGKAGFVNGLPDEAEFRLTFAGQETIAGPILLDLWATTTAPDTDFFVDILDRDDHTGALTYLQRGMQRASHRAVDELRSDRIESGPLAGQIYRAHHPHTSPVPVTPLEPTNYLIEIFPLGHVFRTGHSLVLKVHAPPPADPLSIYAWVGGQPPAVNSILNVDGMRSQLLLPLLPTQPSVGAAAPACGSLVGNPCFTPVA